jgi:thioredoxin 1
MPPKKIDPFIIIRDEEHFLQFFNENNKKLLVIDVHPTWSGPCEALYPVYRSFRDDGIVEFEKRMDIVLVDQVRPT